MEQCHQKNKQNFNVDEEDEEDINQIEPTVHFIQRRAKSSLAPAGGRRQRPLSLSSSSQIISNPKLVKSLENLVSAEQKRLTRVHSTSITAVKIDLNKFQEFPEKFLEGIEHQPDSNKPEWYKYLGIFLALFASLVLSLASIVVKSISDQYHPYTLSLWTFQGIFLPSLAVLLFQIVINKQPVLTGVWPLNVSFNLKNLVLILIRALFGSGGTVFKVYSLQYMTAADSTIIAFSSPVFVVIVAWVFLREKCGVVPIVTALIVLVGVGIITRPPLLTGEQEFDADLLIGCSMAFSCMLLGTFVVVILRYVRDVHYALITFIYGFVGTISSLALCIWVDSLEAPKCLKHWLLAVSVASLTFIGQSTLTLALQYEQAGPIGIIRTSEIIFTFGWQLIFFNVLPDLLSVVGAVVVVIGVFIITIRKWISTLPRSHSARKSCRLLLF